MCKKNSLRVEYINMDHRVAHRSSLSLQTNSLSFALYLFVYFISLGMCGGALALSVHFVFPREYLWLKDGPLLRV